MNVRRSGDTVEMSTTEKISNDERHTVATYLSDMLALEQHIAAPVESQLGSAEHQSYPEAARIIQTIKSVTTSHVAALDAQLKALGGAPGHGIKSAWAQFLGGGAAALNNARKTKVSKSLRDDYTALGLATISYTMLHATAAGLGDGSTAALAKRHLDDLTPIVVSISKAIPGIVLQELADDGENVAITAAEATKQVSGDAWSGENTKSGSTR